MNEHQAATRQAIREALAAYDRHHIATICTANPYALDYLISTTLEQQDTINHIKNIISED